MRTTDPIRTHIESLLFAAGWVIQNHDAADLQQALGVVIRDFPLARGYGAIDYLLCIEGKAAGIIERQPETTDLTGVPVLSEKYTRGLPFTLRLFVRPLPFLYQSTGQHQCFTNAFDPEPGPHPLIAFHRPETLRIWLEDGIVGETPRDMAAEYFPEHRRRGRTFHERMLINMPPLTTDGLSVAQIRTLRHLENSFKENRPRVLVDMPADSDRTTVVIRGLDRLLKFADVRRVLYLVNSADIGQRLAQFMQETLSPDDHRLFTKTWTVQHLTHQAIASDARLCITTLPHLHNLLLNQDLAEKDPATTHETPVSALQYNPDVPIETFDLIVIDTCNAAVTHYFRPALEYFDAHVIGLTSKPDQQALDFFDNNVIMGDLGQAPADGLNVIS